MGKKIHGTINTTIVRFEDTLEGTFTWCREYPAQIGRKVEGCIGISTFSLA